jgi:ABC-type branched-subunit amino acid transport system substrate-binding protein
MCPATRLRPERGMTPPARRRRRVAAGLVAMLVPVVACGAAPPSRPMPVGPGVTATTISLGVLTDLTGSLGALGRTVTQGVQLFWDDQDRRGGVCGRDVRLVIEDHGHNPQRAASIYTEMQPRVLALQQLLGMSEAAGLLPRIGADTMLTQPVSWSSKLLSTPGVVVAGATYDLEMINGIDWLMRTRGLKAGDTVGDILLDGEEGDDALLGTMAAARAHGLTVVPERIRPGDTDLAVPVRAIRASGARAIMITSTPSQAASAASIADSDGYDVTFVGSNPSFVPSLLRGPARTAMERRYVVAQSYAPFSGDLPGVTAVRDEYTAVHPGESVNAGADYGYGQGEVMYRILDAACRGGSLRRPALLQALQRLTNVDTGGLIAPLDLSKRGQPPARATYILRPDGTAAGGLRVLAPLFASPLAQGYRCPC